MGREAFDGNFVALVREMDAAARALDEMPDDKEFTQDELAGFDDVRRAALKLARAAEATIEVFEGK